MSESRQHSRYGRRHFRRTHLPEQTATTEATERSAPSTVTRALNSLGVGFVIGALTVGGTLGVRYFFFEPQEQEPAYIQVMSASDAELRAQSYEELINLKANVSRFGSRTPGMLMPAVDQEDRIERAMTAKRSRQ